MTHGSACARRCVAPERSFRLPPPAGARSPPPPRRSTPLVSRITSSYPSLNRYALTFIENTAAPRRKKNRISSAGTTPMKMYEQDQLPPDTPQQAPLDHDEEARDEIDQGCRHRERGDAAQNLDERRRLPSHAKQRSQKLRDDRDDEQAAGPRSQQDIPSGARRFRRRQRQTREGLPATSRRWRFRESGRWHRIENRMITDYRYCRISAVALGSSAGQTSSITAPE